MDQLDAAIDRVYGGAPPPSPPSQVTTEASAAPAPYDNGAPPLKLAADVKEPGGESAPVPGAAAPAPKEPAAAPADPLDAVINKVYAKRTPTLSETLAPLYEAAKQQELVTHFATWRSAHSDATPEQQLEILQYSAASGLGAEAVAQTLPELKKTVDQTRLQTALLRTPGLASFIADAKNTALVKDDVAAASKVEGGLRGDWHHITQAFQEGREEQEFVELTNKAAVGLARPDDFARIVELDVKRQESSDTGWHWYSKWLPATARMLPYLAGSAAAHGTGTFLGAAAAGEAGAEAGGAVGAGVGAVAGGVGAVPGAGVGAAVGGVGGAVAGGATGAKVANFAFNFYENFGPTYWRLKSLKNSDGGHLLDEDSARLYAAGASGLGAALMGAATTKVLQKLPGMERVMGRLGTDIIGRALAQPSVARTLAVAPLKFGAHLAETSLMVAGQAAANTGAEVIAQGEAGQGWHPEQVAQAGAEAWVSAMQDMAGLAALGVGRETLGAARTAYRSERAASEGTLSPKPQEEAMRLALAVEGAKESKLLERSPEKFEELVRLQQAGRVPHVYVDGDAWARYAEKKGVEAGALAADVIGDGGKAYAEATATGGDLPIPIEKYLSKLKDEHDQLSSDIRLSSDSLSLNQASSLLASKVKEAASAAELNDDGAGDIYRDVYAKQVAAGMPKEVADANATMWGAFFRNLGQHLGRDALNTYEDLVQVRVRGPKSEVAQGSDASFEFGANAEPPQRALALEEVTGLISRMSPENRDAATAFLEYTQGKRERPRITSDMERKLARFGVVDPKGYAFEESGRTMARLLAGRKVRGPEPEEFRRIREANLEHALRHGSTRWLKQEGLAEAARIENPNLRPMREAYAKLTPEERARKLHLDRVTGVREASVFDDAPVPEGKVVAIITSPSVKGINDHPTAGGHDVANALLMDMAHAVAKDHLEAARGGTNFRVLLDAGKADEQLMAVLDRVRKAVGPGIDVVGAHGKDVSEANDKLRVTTDSARQEGTLPARGALRPETRVENLAFRGRQAKAKPPMEFVRKMAETPEAEAFKHTYLDHVWVTRDGKRVAEASGLLTDKGFNETPPRAHTIAFDMKGLGKVPREVGDEMVLRFGRALREAGGDHVDAAHKSGDEFAAKHDNPAVLQRLERRVREALERDPLKVTLPSGEEVSVDVGYRHGIGSDYAAADRDLNARRRAEEAGTSNLDRGTDEEVHPGRTVEDDILDGRTADLAAAGPPDANGAVQSGPGGDRGEVRPTPGVEGAGETGLEGEVAELGQAGKVRLDQRSGDGGRGFITFETADGSGKPRQFDIHILESADRSTFAHESAHFFGEVLGDAANLPDASAELKADYQTLLTFMGHASHEERQAHAKERLELSRIEKRTPEQERRLTSLTAKEERFSHAWEQYLVEGKPPSAELARPFARFKRWLTSIYRGVQGIARQFRQEYGEDLNLSDDVRQVFDRLLASEDEIAKSQSAEDAQPFNEAQAQMTPAELTEYTGAITNAREQAERDLLERITRAERRENSAFMDEERATTRAQVEAELDANPTHRSIKALKEGHEFLKAPDGGPLRLSRESLVRKYGPEFVRSMPRGIFAEKGKGVPAEEVSALLGWESGDEMVRALQASVPREQLASGETQKRMEEKFGPSLLDNGPKLADMAIEAVHNPAAARKAVLELNALRRALRAGVPDTMSGDKAAFKKLQETVAADKAASAREASQSVEDAREQTRIERGLRDVLNRGLKYEDIQETARRLMAEKTVGNITAGDQGLSGAYLRAERTAAKRALESASRGDYLQAIAWKEKQLLNMALYREARDLRSELEAATDKLKGSGKDTWREYLGKANPAYRDAHDAILQAIGMQEGPTGQTPAGLDALVARAAADAQDLAFDVDALRELAANPRPWDELSVEEARNVMDAVTNIRTAARELTTIQIEGRRLSRDAFFAQAEAAVAGLPLEPLRPRDRNMMPFTQKARGVLQHFDSLLLNTETMVGMLTGGKRDSVVHGLLVDGYLKARNHEAELSKQFLDVISKQWEALPKELRARRDELVDISKDLPISPEAADAGYVDPGGKVQRAQLWMMALNMGNAGNKERLTKGYGWTEDRVQKVLDRELTAPEWTWVQGVWNSLEGLYPLIEAVHEKETGRKPEKVVATTVRTPHGEYPGGYFPARYDSRYSEHGARQVEGSGDVRQILGSALDRPAVGYGHAKSRVEGYARPVDLNWSVVPAHVAQVLHDVAFRSYVKGTAGILMDPRMKTLLTKRLGEEYAGQFVPWLQSVATSRADAVPANLATSQRILGWLRSRVATQALGLNLGVALGDFSNPVVGLATGDLRPLPLAHALTKTVAHWGEIRGFALENSPELRYRGERVGKKLLEQLGDMGGGRPKSALSRAIQDTAFVFMEWSDKLTATPMWFAKYQQELAAGRPHEEAVRAGDDLVRKLFPAEHVSEGPAFTRNRLTGSLVMFYGYMNKVYNLQRGMVSEAADVFRDEGAGIGAKAGAAAKAAGKLLAVSAAVGGLSEFLSGRGPEGDESWEEWLARKVLLGPISTLPLVGQLAEPIARKLSGHKATISVRQAPGLAVAQKAAETLGAAFSAAKGDELKERDILNGLELLGLAGNIPTRQLRRTGEYAAGLATGNAQPRGPADVAGGLVYGARSNPATNPGTALQDALSAP